MVKNDSRQSGNRMLLGTVRINTNNFSRDRRQIVVLHTVIVESLIITVETRFEPVVKNTIATE